MDSPLRDLFLRIDEELRSILEQTVYHNDDYTPRNVMASGAACRLLLEELANKIDSE